MYFEIPTSALSDVCCPDLLQGAHEIFSVQHSWQRCRHASEYYEPDDHWTNTFLSETTPETHLVSRLTPTTCVVFVPPRFARNGGVDAKDFQRMWREREKVAPGSGATPGGEPIRNGVELGTSGGRRVSSSQGWMHPEQRTKDHGAGGSGGGGISSEKVFEASCNLRGFRGESRMSKNVGNMRNGSTAKVSKHVENTTTAVYFSIDRHRGNHPSQGGG